VVYATLRISDACGRRFLTRSAPSGVADAGDEPGGEIPNVKLVSYGEGEHEHWAQTWCTACGAWLPVMADRFEEIGGEEVYRYFWECRRCATVRTEVSSSPPNRWSPDAAVKPEPVGSQAPGWVSPSAYALTQAEREVARAPRSRVYLDLRLRLAEEAAKAIVAKGAGQYPQLRRWQRFLEEGGDLDDRILQSDQYPRLARAEDVCRACELVLTANLSEFKRDNQDLDRAVTAFLHEGG